MGFTSFSQLRTASFMQMAVSASSLGQLVPKLMRSGASADALHIVRKWARDSDTVSKTSVAGLITELFMGGFDKEAGVVDAWYSRSQSPSPKRTRTPSPTRAAKRRTPSPKRARTPSPNASPRRLSPRRTHMPRTGFHDLMDYDEKHSSSLDSYIRRGVYMSQKYDGWRMYWDGERAYSRSGKKVVHCLPPHWVSALKAAGDVTLDGEIYLDGLPLGYVATLWSAKCTELVKLLWKWAVYLVFDVPSHGHLPFSERIKIGEAACKRIKDAWGGDNSHIQFIPQKYTTSPSVVEKYFQKVTLGPRNCAALGDQLRGITLQNAHENKRLNEIREFCKSQTLPGEGLVLVVADSRYESGSSQQKRKYKARLDNECVVLYPNEAHNSLRVKRVDTDVEFNLPVNNNDSKFNYPRGTVITFTASGYSKSGTPLQPKLLRIRHEEMRGAKAAGAAAATATAASTAASTVAATAARPKPKKAPSASAFEVNEEIAKYFFQKGKDAQAANDRGRLIAYFGAAKKLRAYPKDLRKEGSCVDAGLTGPSMKRQCEEQLEKYR